MSDIARSKLDYLTQEVYHDLNVLTNKIEAITQNLEEKTRVLNRTMGDLTDLHDHVTSSCAQAIDSTNQFLQEAFTAHQEQWTSTLDTNSKTWYDKRIDSFKKDLETAASQIAREAVVKSFGEGFQSVVKVVDTQAEHLLKVTEQAHNRVKKIVLRDKLSFGGKVLILAVGIVMASAFTILLSRRMETFFPAYDKETTEYIRVGKALSSIWPVLDEKTKGKIVKAIQDVPKDLGTPESTQTKQEKTKE